MNFKQLQSAAFAKTVGCDLNRHTHCFGHTIAETADGKVWIDRKQTDFDSLEEAREYLHQQKIQQDIQHQIEQEIYEEMSDNKVADIIRSHYSDVKITDTLIESYIELASSKIFTADAVAQQIRKLNTFDKLVENRVDFVLKDGSVVVISDSTQTAINNIFGKHQDVIEYMRESKENFLSVVNQLEE